MSSSPPDEERVEAIARIIADACNRHMDAVSSCTVWAGPGSKSVQDAARAIQALSLRDGGAEWVLVPREPTREMWAAAGDAVTDLQTRGIGHHDKISEAVYRAMISASPHTLGEEVNQGLSILPEPASDGVPSATTPGAEPSAP